MRISDERSIFDQAIEIKDRQARLEFLRRSCNGDPDKRQKIERRVDVFLCQGGKAMELTTACQRPETSPLLPRIGSRIGPYKLLQEIGEGGMGLVYMAEQTRPVKRKVALKVIKIGMDTRRVVARFESERQAMALMDHPCITKVLDAGTTETGRPYFVMELVRGQSITEYCDQRRLTLQQRLEIFARVCNALEHAHQKGIIHRDIKPSNIMVTSHDGLPVPKIIDFGIAKAVDDSLTDKTLFTNYGEMIGTPMYMSPEQAEMSALDVDTRADIYSLGVVLYELLTGTTPFHTMRNKSLHEFRDAIRSQSPQLASTRVNQLGDTINEVTSNRDTDVRSLQRFIRGELDWILMKCLARERDRRYQSAGELAREIQRYLDGDNVEAAAPTLRYRAGKFVTRHRGAVAIAVGFLFLLIGATSFSTTMAVKANRAEELASSRLDEVIKERDRALAAEKQLAELERRQRNRVAVHKAASKYNADMVKRYLNQWTVAEGNPTSLTKPPVFQFKTMGSPYLPAFGDSGRPASGSPPVQPATFVTTDASCASGDWMVANNDDAIEVIVVPEKNDHELELLTSILENQKNAFGNHDMIVVQTLERLGELMSDKGQWEKSETYFREAAQILECKSNHGQGLAEIHVKLVKASKNKKKSQKGSPE